MKICFNHNWSRAWRDRETRVDYQNCLVCGKTRVSSIQFGESRYVKPDPATATTTTTAATALPQRALRPVRGWMGGVQG